MPYLFHIFKLLNVTFYVFTLQGLGVFYPFVCLTLSCDLNNNPQCCMSEGLRQTMGPMTGHDHPWPIETSGQIGPWLPVLRGKGYFLTIITILFILLLLWLVSAFAHVLSWPFWWSSSVQNHPLVSISCSGPEIWPDQVPNMWLPAMWEGLVRSHGCQWEEGHLV